MHNQDDKRHGGSTRGNGTGEGEENGNYDLTVHLARVDTYRTMTEKPLYTWDQLACEVGGFIGLVMGLSIISIIEVAAYICLKTAKHFFMTKHIRCCMKDDYRIILHLILMKYTVSGRSVVKREFVKTYFGITSVLDRWGC